MESATTAVPIPFSEEYGDRVYVQIIHASNTIVEVYSNK